MQTPAHDDDINTVTYLDESGNLFASGSDDQLVKIWDRRVLGSTAACVGVLPGHFQGITHVSSKVFEGSENGKGER